MLALKALGKRRPLASKALDGYMMFCKTPLVYLEFAFMPKITFIDSHGSRHEFDAPEGLSVLEVAHQNDINLEGACEGSLACSTCHVVVDPAWYDKLNEPSEEEEDMLDLAFALTHTSRLGCQIKLTKELDGLVVTLPVATRNMLLD